MLIAITGENVQPLSSELLNAWPASVRSDTSSTALASSLTTPVLSVLSVSAIATPSRRRNCCA